MRKKELEVELQDLKSEIRALKKMIGQIYDAFDLEYSFERNKFVSHKFEKLLEYLQIEYTEEKFEGYKKICKNK